jgi:transcriptional regulator CtsR
LALPCNEAKQIEIHSQNPRNVYLPKKNIDNKFRVIPSSINHIAIQTKTFTADV